MVPLLFMISDIASLKLVLTDIPFLSRRLLINGLPIPSCMNFQNRKPWEINLADTFQYWRFGDYKHYTSLKLLAAALYIPSPKDDIDGSMVGKVYWEEMGLDRITAYCCKDVVTVANIILRFIGRPILNEQDVAVEGNPQPWRYL